MRELTASRWTFMLATFIELIFHREFSLNAMLHVECSHCLEVLCKVGYWLGNFVKGAFFRGEMYRVQLGLMDRDRKYGKVETFSLWNY